MSRVHCFYKQNICVQHDQTQSHFLSVVHLKSPISNKCIDSLSNYHSIVQNDIVNLSSVRSYFITLRGDVLTTRLRLHPQRGLEAKNLITKTVQLFKACFIEVLSQRYIFNVGMGSAAE
uniref:Uncharacterized protein n=1 Tax=Glossina pallidipes TaxID=7398 RepID=A0A1A9Z2S9_GLOPL